MQHCRRGTKSFSVEIIKMVNQAYRDKLPLSLSLKAKVQKVRQNVRTDGL